MPSSLPRPAGPCGEAIAALFLESRGYVVRARNYRSGRREIDLVVERGRTLVFVEVKWRRRDPRFGGAAEAWRPAQRRRAAAAAWAAAAEFAPAGARALRFDLVTLEESEHGLVLEHRRGAWTPGGGGA
jgi:putative endonuclease